MSMVAVSGGMVPDLTGKGVRVMAVLTQRQDGKYEGRVGIVSSHPSRERAASIEVANNGAKLPWLMACTYFVVKIEEYVE